MDPWRLFVAFFTFFHCLVSQSLQSFQLKPDTVALAPNISIETGSNTNVIDNEWNIEVKTQYGSDINIQFGAFWGFDPTYSSTIKLILNGNTANATYTRDGEI